MDGSWWRVLTECGPLEQGMATSVFLPWEPHEQYERQKDRTLKDELPRSVGAQYAIGEEWRNNSRKNEEMEPKQKQYPVVDVTGDGRNVWCCKEQYCIRSVQFISVAQSCPTLWDPMMVLLPVSCTMSQTSVHSSSGTLSVWSSPLNLFLTFTM